ncbi:MAG: Gfo/Idh/MocA family oxidoreductase [Terriglobia bacterium]|jgi:predicted dehydrogenase
MSKQQEITRRKFLKDSAFTGAGLAAYSGISFITDPARGFGANDRIRFGLIGCGDRGQEDLQAALACPNVECVALADVYTRRLDELQRIVPGAKPYRDFRRILDDKSIDAVVIVTPQHQHVLNFVPAIQAGKDVYQEKTMASSTDHARRMRKAFEGSGRVVQVGIQSVTAEVFDLVKSLNTPENMGEITALHTHMYRNAPYGGWKRPIPADCDLQHVDWKGFEGEAPPHDWDPNRYINWRFFWDYDGSNVFENMVHQVGFWYKVLGLKIPRGVMMNGGNYLSPDMEMPDTIDVSMDQPENLLFTWNCGFGNRHYKAEDDFLLGNKGTIFRGRYKVEYTPEDRPRGSAGKVPESRILSAQGKSDGTNEHFQNFFDCVRSRKEPNCPFELGYRSAIACQMAIRSYHEGRKVHWDAENEEIV